MDLCIRIHTHTHIEAHQNTRVLCYFIFFFIIVSLAQWFHTSVSLEWLLISQEWDVNVMYVNVQINKQLSRIRILQENGDYVILKL